MISLRFVDCFYVLAIVEALDLLVEAGEFLGLDGVSFGGEGDGGLFEELALGTAFVDDLTLIDSLLSSSLFLIIFN